MRSGFNQSLHAWHCVRQGCRIWLKCKTKSWTFLIFNFPYRSWHPTDFSVSYLKWMFSLLPTNKKWRKSDLSKSAIYLPSSFRITTGSRPRKGILSFLNFNVYFAIQKRYSKPAKLSEAAILVAIIHMDVHLLEDWAITARVKQVGWKENIIVISG